MKKRVLILLVILIASSFFYSCQMEFYPSLKISEIIALCDSKDKKPYMTDIVIQVQVSSDKDFDEHKDKITEILSNYFTEVTNVRTKSRDMLTFYVADAKIPVYISNNISENASDKILINAVNTKNTYRIGLSIGKNFLSNLNSSIPDNFYQSFEIKDLAFTFNIINDTENNLTVKTYSVYIDNVATPFASEMSVEPNANYAIRLSEIYRDYIGSNGKGVFYEFTINKKPEKKQNSNVK